MYKSTEKNSCCVNAIFESYLTPEIMDIQLIVEDIDQRNV